MQKTLAAKAPVVLRGRMLRDRAASALAGVAALLSAAAAHAAPVLMISIDGLRPADVLEADKRGVKVPTLQSLVRHGAYATDVVNEIPTVTYPNHTTLITGVRPDVHGIANNLVFDPLQRNQEGWYWYASDIKAETLWQAVHDRGGVVASIGWPVSVGARSIDENIPEYWRAHTDEDVKLLRVLSTPGLVERIEPLAGAPFSALTLETAAGDAAKARYAAAIYATVPPAFFTLHFSSLDEAEHVWGPGTPQAYDDLAAIDGDVAEVVAAARKAEPDVVIVVVSDHGFAPLEHDVNLLKPFADAGLITIGRATHKPTSWLAEPWGGASAAVVLADPKDEAVRARVRSLLAKLASDPSLGIDRVVEGPQIARLGATRDAAFLIDFKLGYEMGQDLNAPPVRPSLARGMHGWFNDHPEMHSTFIIDGPDVPRRGALGQIDMIRIAPTVAKVLNVALPDAKGVPLF